MGIKNFSSLYVWITIAETMDLNGGNPLLKALCALADPLGVSCFEATSLSFL